MVPVARHRAKQLEVHLAKTNRINARQPEGPVNNGPATEKHVSLYSDPLIHHHRHRQPRKDNAPRWVRVSKDLLRFFRRRGGPQFVGPRGRENLTGSKLCCRSRTHSNRKQASVIYKNAMSEWSELRAGPLSQVLASP